MYLKATFSSLRPPGLGLSCLMRFFFGSVLLLGLGFKAFRIGGVHGTEVIYALRFGRVRLKFVISQV